MNRLKLCVLTALLASGAHAGQRERVLLCVSPSHEGYSAELFYEELPDGVQEYNLEVSSERGLPYNIFFKRGPELSLKLVSKRAFKFGRHVNTDMFFSQLKRNEFVLYESTYLPPQFEERSIVFLCESN